MFETFTGRARQTLLLAQEEARLLDHSFVGTEHLLLGLMREGEGVAAKSLESLGISLEDVRHKVQETIGSAGRTGLAGYAPTTTGANKVLERSLREAADLGRIGTEKLLREAFDLGHVGTEHILLGLVQDEDGEAAQVLVSLGADLSQVRQEVLRVRSEVRPPSCPTCGASQTEYGVWSTLSIPSADQRGGLRSFAVIYCRACGTAISVLPDDPNA